MIQNQNYGLLMSETADAAFGRGLIASPNFEPELSMGSENS
jgi:hypothetical protein